MGAAICGGWTHLRAADLDEPLSRAFLALLAVATIVLAAGESHEAIGTALVGAAVAFALGATFFDRVVELSPRGVKLREQLEKLDEVAEQELAGTDPQEKEEVVEKGREILLDSRSTGQPISPESALREAQISWAYNGFAAEIRFASWLVSQGWTVSEADRLIAVDRPDLVAEKDGRRIAVEVKVGSQKPLAGAVIDQLPSVAASVEAAMAEDVAARGVLPVLVIRGLEITKATAARAARTGISVYRIDEEGKVRHLLGPEL